MFIIYFRYFRFSGHSIISGFGNRDMLKAATDLPYHVLELFLVITGLSFNGDQERSSGHYRFFASPDLSKGEEVLRKFMAMPDRA